MKYTEQEIEGIIRLSTKITSLVCKNNTGNMLGKITFTEERFRKMLAQMYYPKNLSDEYVSRVVECVARMHAWRME